jgi:hypothetical protein
LRADSAHRNCDATSSPTTRQIEQRRFGAAFASIATISCIAVPSIEVVGGRDDASALRPRRPIALAQGSGGIPGGNSPQKPWKSYNFRPLETIAPFVRAPIAAAATGDHARADHTTGRTTLRGRYRRLAKLFNAINGLGPVHTRPNRAWLPGLVAGIGSLRLPHRSDRTWGPITAQKIPGNHPQSETGSHPKPCLT